jgi:hypothetical protein
MNPAMMINCAGSNKTVCLDSLWLHYLYQMLVFVLSRLLVLRNTSLEQGRGSGPKVGAIFFPGGRPNFLKPSKLREKQTDSEQREALLLTALPVYIPPRVY